MSEQNNFTKNLISERIQQVPRSFIRDILSVTNSPEIISFAGGLPNKKYFPVKEIQQCTIDVLANNGDAALQYSTTEGLPELREHISLYYKQQRLNVPVDRILITTGSQQALDLIGKVFINKGDAVLLEEPAYLGAIQAFSMYQPNFTTVALTNEGIDCGKLADKLRNEKIKLAYMVPNFQNPSGISYSEDCRKEVAELSIKNNLLMVEDDPYGAICFTDNKFNSLYHYAPDQTILLGTFSKTVAPGFRMGWIVAPNEEIYNRLVIAKQAADLHSDIFSQRIISTFLSKYDLNIHMEKIIEAYRNQSQVMTESMKEYFPQDISFTKPEGGMFCWVTMPDGFSAMTLFNEAIKQKVAFVPGVPFYIGKNDTNTFRLNFSCSSPDEIRVGVKRLKHAMETCFQMQYQ